MSFIKKSDKYSETMAESVKKALFETDTTVTMRFSELRSDEVYSNVMAFGNTRFWLQTGILQWEKMADTLEKWKKWKADVKADPNAEKPEEVDSNAEYKMTEVEDIIERWHGCSPGCSKSHIHIKGYKPQEFPWSEDNMVWIVNHGIRYNRVLMTAAGFFEPVHTGTLNTRYAVEGRTFKAVVELGKAERGREETIEREENGGEKKGWMSRHNPFKN